jgi:hypothetical protein
MFVGRLTARLRQSYGVAAFAICWLAQPKRHRREGWWSQTGSNRRPHACKARALPAELWPRNQKTNARIKSIVKTKVLSYPSSPFRASPGTLRSTLERGCATRSRRRSVVGLGRLELPTSRLSSARSNQLSYKPLTRGTRYAHNRRQRRMHRTSALAPGACSSAKKEKRRRRNPAYGAQQS